MIKTLTRVVFFPLLSLSLTEFLIDEFSFFTDLAAIQSEPASVMRGHRDCSISLDSSVDVLDEEHG